MATSPGSVCGQEPAGPTSCASIWPTLVIPFLVICCTAIMRALDTHQCLWLMSAHICLSCRAPGRARSQRERWQLQLCSSWRRHYHSSNSSSTRCHLKRHLGSQRNPRRWQTPVSPAAAAAVVVAAAVAAAAQHLTVPSLLRRAVKVMQRQVEMTTHPALTATAPAESGGNSSCWQMEAPLPRACGRCSCSCGIL